jgi:hypothetical protein
VAGAVLLDKVSDQRIVNADVFEEANGAIKRCHGVDRDCMRRRRLSRA